MAEPVLSAEGVSFRYNSDSILQDVSFSLYEHEIVTLLGPSGCGKTTLLNLMAGFLHPVGGRLRFQGQAIRGPSPERAVVFQTGALFEWMTVRQNIEFSLRCRRVPVSERRKVSDDMIRLVGLDGSGERYTYELSGGMKQRVGVARVIAANPRIMLMDEPFAAVDVQTRESLQEELLRIHDATRCTIVFVTHSIEEAVFLSDRIFLLSPFTHDISGQFEVKLPGPRWNDRNRLHQRFLQLREEIYVAMRDLGRSGARTDDERPGIALAN